MCHYVCTPFERAAVDRCGKGIVDDKGNPMAMGNPCEPFYVKHLHSGVRYRFPKHEFGPRPEGGLYLFIGGIVVDESYFDTHLWQCDPKQVHGTAIDVVEAYYMVSRFAYVEAGEQVRSLSR